jgi:hypothetical protein
MFLTGRIDDGQVVCSSAHTDIHTRTPTERQETFLKCFYSFVSVRGFNVQLVASQQSDGSDRTAYLDLSVWRVTGLCPLLSSVAFQSFTR